jgi:hypothetical protein
LRDITGLVQKADMMRPGACLSIVLLASGCAAAPKPQPPRPVASIPAAPPRGEPPRYINQPATVILSRFGRPAFVRKDGSIEMWRYDGQACRAFIFFYGAPLAVRHIETLPRGATSAADQGCLTALTLSPPKTS